MYEQGLAPMPSSKGCELCGVNIMNEGLSDATGYVSGLCDMSIRFTWRMMLVVRSMSGEGIASCCTCGIHRSQGQHVQSISRLRSLQ
jgi:hypothetical protein